MMNHFSRLVTFTAACITLMSSATVAQVDKTIIANESGQSVVDTVVRRITQSNIFPSDYSFLRRIAYVESKDGTDASTYRPGYYGGIWQVDKVGFQNTQDTKSHPALVNKFAAINAEFGIDWSQTTWEDLAKPLYSGLAARLFLSTLPQAIPTTVQDQGAYWKKNYNSAAGAGTAEKFVSDVAALESKVTCSLRANVMFVLDSSGSISSSDYDLARDFIANLIPGLNVAPNKSKVGLIYYSTNTFLYQPLTDDATAAQAAAKNVPKEDSGTNTGQAINLATQVLRDNKFSGSSLMVVLTDGRSGDDVIRPAKAANAGGITTVAVGIGSSIDSNQLLDIANGNAVNVIFSSSFGAISNTVASIKSAACSAPLTLNLGTSSSSLGDTVSVNGAELTYGVARVPREGTTITLLDSSRAVNGYASFGFQTPNPAYYEILITPGLPVFISPPAPKTFGHQRAMQTGVSTNSTNTTDLFVGFSAPSNTNATVTFLVKAVAGKVTVSPTTRSPVKPIKRVKPVRKPGKCSKGKRSKAGRCV